LGYGTQVLTPFVMAIQLTAKATSLKTVMLQLEPDLYVRIKAAAKRHNLPAAVAMRQILEQGIEEVEAHAE
jgi:predicted DNA-binding protein